MVKLGTTRFEANEGLESATYKFNRNCHRNLLLLYPKKIDRALFKLDVGRNKIFEEVNLKWLLDATFFPRALLYSFVGFLITLQQYRAKRAKTNSPLTLSKL